MAAAEHLFKLQLDGLDEGLGHKLSSFPAEFHGPGHFRHLEVHHHTVCVSIDHLTVCLVPIGLVIRLCHQLPAILTMSMAHLMSL